MHNPIFGNMECASVAASCSGCLIEPPQCMTRFPQGETVAASCGMSVLPLTADALRAAVSALMGCWQYLHRYSAGAGGNGIVCPIDSTHLRDTLDVAAAQLLPGAQGFVPCLAVLGTVCSAEAIKSMGCHHEWLSCSHST